MPIDVSFTDLSHTGKTVDANYFPLACGYVAAYAAEHLGGEIAPQIFKYPKDFSAYLERITPRIICFSNYSWSFRLNYAYASRVKAKHPETIVIFGGPNYPIDAGEQEVFLREFPIIDFYIDGEGEVAFTELFRKLQKYDFDAEKFKSAGGVSENTHYIYGDKFVRCELMPRIQEMDIVPSPFLNGMFDKFFDPILTPLMQSHRGCPYSCAFCHDGISYMSKVRRFSQERINGEIEYILEHHQVPNLCFADLNFGIYKEDLVTTRLLSGVQEKYGWPKFIESAVAKNHKDRVVEMANSLHGGFYVGASIQSTDPEVLKNIQRSNVNLDQLVEMAQGSVNEGNPSLSEVILCLPGDSKEKHMKSVSDVLDIGIEEIRMYQFILLAGTVGASQDYKERFGYETLFRVLPRCFGRYEVYGEPFEAFEYHEVCVGSNTMSHEDYRECRKFNLMVEIFNNGGLFNELLAFLELKGIPRSAVFKKLFGSLDKNPVLSRLFQDFMEDEDRNFWPDEEAVRAFIREPGVLDKYIAGEYGANQIMEYRAKALMDYMDHVAEAIFAVGRDLLDGKGCLDEQAVGYLVELQDFILLRKGNLFSLGDGLKQIFHYDFVKLGENKFKEDPFGCRVPEGLEIKFAHSDELTRDIEAYSRQYGKTAAGFGHFMQRGTLASLFRGIDYV